LSGFNIGDTVTLQVRAWDAGGIGLTYDDVKAAGGLWGGSITLTYLIPAGTFQDLYYMHNFQSFSLVPEPSTIALVVVAAFGLLWWRRRTQ
jgi:hypothetical protein